MQNNENQSFFDRAKITANVTRAGVRVLNKPLVFLGYLQPAERALGPSGYVAALVLLILPAFFPDSNPWPIYLLLCAYLIKGCIHRAVWIYRWYKQYPLVGHSEALGTPLLAKALPRCPSKFIPWIEPPIAFLAGLVLFPLNHLFGGYLMCAAICLFVDRVVDLCYERTVLLNEHDRNIVAKIRAERLRQAEGQ